jgi:hypothetical protein
MELKRHVLAECNKIQQSRERGLRSNRYQYLKRSMYRPVAAFQYTVNICEYVVSIVHRLFHES